MNRARPAPLLAAPLGVLLPAVLVLAAGCGDGDPSDAYGNFEATETTVSAQAEGRLLRLTVDEGDRVGAGDVVGLVDTVQLAAARDALLARRRGLLGQQRSLRAQAAAARAGRDAALAQGSATLATVAEAQAAADALAARLAAAREELARTDRLLADAAATARERNERAGQAAVLAEQVEQARARGAAVRAQAATSGAQARVQSVQAGVPEAQAAAVADEVAGLDAELAAVADRIARAAVRNPVAGTVLTVAARPGEVVATGAPLYTVADLGALRLRAYATGDQLPRLRLGMPVDVRVDDGAGGLRTLAGAVVWVAAEAQFTPTPVQTRDERAELVYAFDVRVANPDGALKVGMPGEVRFRPAAAPRPR